MNENDLPPLPRVSERSVDAAFWGGERLFTAEQMRDYALGAVALCGNMRKLDAETVTSENGCGASARTRTGTP